MFPFDYIPKTIDPTLRFILIVLISIQFIAFLFLFFYMLYEHITKKYHIGQLEDIQANQQDLHTKERQAENSQQDKDMQENDLKQPIVANANIEQQEKSEDPNEYEVVDKEMLQKETERDMSPKEVGSTADPSYEDKKTK